MTRRPLVVSFAAGLGLAVLLGAAPALAQPGPDARAQAAALFEDGRLLMAENKFAEACPKLEESQRMDPGMGTLYHVSVCYEALGRTASAWVGFRDVAQLAAAAGQPDRERAARGKTAALEPKLMRLKITVAPGNQSAGVEVKRDGAVVSPALWGTSVPLDPGRHKVSASAPGKEPWEMTVQLDQPGGTVSVDVPPLLEKKAGSGPNPPPPPTPPPGPTGPGDTGTPPPPLVATNPRPWQMPLGIALTVVGAGGLGGGIGLGVLAKSAFNASNTGTPPNCDATTNKCNAAGLGQRSDAVTKGNIGTGVFAAGAALAAAGIIVWVTAPSSSAPKIGLGPTGAVLRGTW